MSIFGRIWRSDKESDNRTPVQKLIRTPPEYPVTQGDDASRRGAVAQLFPQAERSVFRKPKALDLHPSEMLIEDQQNRRGAARAFAGLSAKLEEICLPPIAEDKQSDRQWRARLKNLKTVADQIQKGEFASPNAKPSQDDADAMLALTRLLELNKGSKWPQKRFRVETFSNAVGTDAGKRMALADPGITGSGIYEQLDRIMQRHVSATKKWEQVVALNERVAPLVFVASGPGMHVREGDFNFFVQNTLSNIVRNHPDDDAHQQLARVREALSILRPVAERVAWANIPQGIAPKHLMPPMACRVQWQDAPHNPFGLQALEGDLPDYRQKPPHAAPAPNRNIQFSRMPSQPARHLSADDFPDASASGPDQPKPHRADTAETSTTEPGLVKELPDDGTRRRVRVEDFRPAGILQRRLDEQEGGPTGPDTPHTGR
jgi:hypothetical protein